MTSEGEQPVQDSHPKMVLRQCNKMLRETSAHQRQALESQSKSKDLARINVEQTTFTMCLLQTEQDRHAATPMELRLARRELLQANNNSRFQHNQLQQRSHLNGKEAGVVAQFDSIYASFNSFALDKPTQ